MISNNRHLLGRRIRVDHWRRIGHGTFGQRVAARLGLWQLLKLLIRLILRLWLLLLLLFLVALDTKLIVCRAEWSAFVDFFVVDRRRFVVIAAIPPLVALRTSET